MLVELRLKLSSLSGVRVSKGPVGCSFLVKGEPLFNIHSGVGSPRGLMCYRAQYLRVPGLAKLFSGCLNIKVADDFPVCEGGSSTTMQWIEGR